MASGTETAAAAEGAVEHAAETATHAAEMAHEAGGAGMPQLDFTTFGNQIFWLVVALVVIYFVLSKVALPRIAGVLAERQGTILNDIAAAEELKQKAIEAEASYNEALAAARAEAAKIVADTKAEIAAELAAAQAEADAQISAKAAESEKAISAIRAGAVQSVKDVAGDVTGDVLGAFGVTADAKAITAAIEARMKG